MIYPEKIEVKLGFDSVRSQISMRCHCEGARLRCADMAFMTDFGSIKSALTAVSEMVAANHSDEALPDKGRASSL